MLTIIDRIFPHKSEYNTSFKHQLTKFNCTNNENWFYNIYLTVPVVQIVYAANENEWTGMKALIVQ